MDRSYLIAFQKLLMRGTYDLHTISTPSLYNNIDLCTLVAPFVKEIVGEENLQIDEEPLAGTEDFSYISQRIPTMFMWARSNGLGNQNYSLHNPNIILDKGVLPLGVAVVVHSAINWLNASHHSSLKTRGCLNPFETSPFMSP